MIRVVLTGIYYPMAILRYLEAALKRRGDVSLFTAGPYTGAWIPWNGGMNLPAKYARAPDFPLPQNAIHAPLPIEMVEARLPWESDLWIQVDAGWFLRGRPKSGKNVFIATDPHVLNYSYQRTLADTFYCMQAIYAEAGDEYLPYAYDPIWHAPEEQPQNFDACLLGLHYQQRNELVHQLRMAGLNVHYDLGPCFDEARALYNQAPIGLNWSSKQDLVARVFELLGMGRLAVVNVVPDLPRFFADGTDLVVFGGLDEAVEQVLYYHQHPDKAAVIAEQGRKTVKPHTWDVRVEQILAGV